MKKLCVSFLMVLCGFGTRGGLVWETGQYTPATWTAQTSGDGNILAEMIADTSAIVYYTEGGKPMTQNAAALTDGVVPGAGIDYTKVFGIKSGSIVWTFESAMTLDSIRIFSRWGDGGRDGIAITKVEVLHAGDTDYTDTGAPAVSYGVGNNTSGGALYAFLADSGGEAVATSVAAIKLTFGAQDNNGSGYVEFEMIGREEGEYLMVAGSPVAPGTPEPAYGITAHTAGDIIPCSAPATATLDGVNFRRTGWKYYENSELLNTGDTASTNITIKAATVSKLVWQWEVAYGATVTLKADGSGDYATLEAALAGLGSDGGVIVLEPGDYPVTDVVVVTNVFKIRSASGDPGTRRFTRAVRRGSMPLLSFPTAMPSFPASRFPTAMSMPIRTSSAAATSHSTRER